GFVLSDHVDWPSLLTAVDACDPETVWVTHGYSAVVARYLRENGRNAISIDRWQQTAIDEEDNGTDTNGEEQSQ
ncbi:DNA ligase-associated DEXH box helicase, partial [bacterium]|nr:DNA ligase-associated DEXH box helicase [bacterium]